MTDQQRSSAIRRIRARRGFRWHLGAYIAVNIALIAVWAATWTGYFWPGWVLLGWGLGVAAHGVAIKAYSTPISEEDIQAELARHGT